MQKEIDITKAWFTIYILVLYIRVVIVQFHHPLLVQKSVDAKNNISK